jgi:F-box-like
MAFERNTPALHDLPTEILLLILHDDSLPASSVLALRQTCRRFRNARSSLPFYEVSFTALGTGKSSSKFEFVQMLQRDSSVPCLQACPACLRLHSPDKYSQTERLMAPSQRQCLFTSKMWICPHKNLDLKNANNMLFGVGQHNPKHLRECNVCHGSMCSWLYKKKENPHELAHEINLMLMTSDPIVPGLTIDAAKQQFAAMRIANLLGKLDAPICKHLRFSDPAFIRRYNPDGLNLRTFLGPYKWIGIMRNAWPFPRKGGSRRRPWKCPERDCDTEFCFFLRPRQIWQVSPPSKPKLSVQLVVCCKRSVRSSTEGMDKSWSDHAISNDEQESMSRSWDTFCSTLIQENQEYHLSRQLCNFVFR